jgi:hypothetical protein
MPTFYRGLPGTIEANPTAPVFISSSTNATPIVVTTATAHGLEPGDYFFITGADDPNAQGPWEAGAVTPTTVTLVKPITGANSVGTMVGGANGMTLALGFADEYAIPSGGDKPNAASINVALEALGDRTQYLEYAKQDARQAPDPGATTGPIALTWQYGNHYVIGPITGNVSLGAVAGPALAARAGQMYSVYVVQDSVGGWTTTWTADFVFGTTYTSVAAAGVGDVTIWLFRSVSGEGDVLVGIHGAHGAALSGHRHSL